jgi:hypothetical protein
MVVALQTTGLGLATNCREETIVSKVASDGIVHEAQPDEFLIYLINRRLTSKDSLRGLVAAIDFLQAFGRIGTVQMNEPASACGQ